MGTIGWIILCWVIASVGFLLGYMAGATFTRNAFQRRMEEHQLWKQATTRSISTN